MLIKNIFIELRWRLRSCNVYITTSIDLNKNCNLKINIQSNCIVLNYYNDSDYSTRRDSLSSIESLSDYSDDQFEDTSIVPIDDFCLIIPNSMSCLKIDKNTISFRVLTQPKNGGGNFYTEFLSATNPTSCIKTNDLIINLKPKTDIKVICANCSNVISIDCVKFDRILELPTENLDMSEWFCHGHAHGSTSQPIVLKQNKNDFLYRLTYFVITNNLLSEKTNKFNLKREIYHCNRCLAWLGLKTKDTVKLFNSEVKIQQNSTESHLFSHNNHTNNISTDDFIYTIECMTKESNLGLQYVVMCKIVLECSISSTHKQYLLIWVMDKELQVLRNDEVIDSDKVKLHSSFLTKILYKVELCLNDEVETWLSDPTVVTTQISRSMFCRGLEHLQSTSQKVPEAFRSSNGYSISYLKV